MDYFTLRALANEWDAALAGWRLDAVWTQSPNELSVGLEHDGERRTLRVVCDPAAPLLFQTEGGGRQRRNTTDVFPDLAGRTLAAVRAADLDRHVFFELEGGAALQALLFGSRPNVLWVESPPRSGGGAVRGAFLRGAEWEGEPAPDPRAAPDPRTPAEVRARWRPNRKTTAQAARSAAPLVPPALAADAVRRAGLDPAAPPADLDDDALGRLAASLAAVRAELERPRPTVTWRGEIAEDLLPAPPTHLGAGWRAEPFDTADAAARVYAKRALGQRRFQALYRPVAAALERAHGRRARSAEAMLDELSRPSRADRYETYAHLLMAQASGDGPGREAVTLPDIVGDGGPVEIPLDPALSAVENAERYYDKARRTRRARDEAEGRWADVQAEADASGALLDRLRALDRVADLETFLADEAAPLAAFVGRGGGEEAAEPFRRVPLPGGFEALVGKHARGNAHLTTKVASPHDLWLHARGVPGSHVVVRRAGRTDTVPPDAVRAAARLAAWFSTAKTQAVVPVTVTERKYVRPVKGGPPGLVRVDREDVVDVTPARPG